MATTNFGCPATRQNVMTSRRFHNCGSVVVVLPALFVVVGLLTTTSCDNVEASSGSAGSSAGSSSVADPIVSTLLGRVRGLRSYVPALGREVDAFLGIPFARPPRGRLRFRHPLPAEPWAPHIYNATRLPDSCHQKPDTAFGDFYGSTVWNSPTPVSEDCLYLNVYVPRNPTVDISKGSGSGGGPRGRRRGPGGRRSLAVMVWIFGGGFYSGTTTLGLYDGKILSVLGDVIVVSIGYRLGALGFLSLGGHREAPGNAGLFDQLMGLDWVQQNIEYFGGDPNNVTLFGESAGSVSVSLHLLSPLSHGKFNRAIMQSGTASMPWAVTSQAEAKRRSLELAVDVIGCQKSNDMMDIVECLRQTPASIIVNEQWVSRGIVQFPFVPIVDGVFLPDEPEELLLRKEFKRCPILMGSNENEASFFMIYELTDLLTLESRSMTSAQYRNSIDRLFEFYPQFRPHHQLSNQALNAIKNQYKPWLDPEDTDRNINALDMAVSDSQFVCPLNNFGHRYALSGQDVFMYFFTERTQYNPWPPWMGVLHGDEIFLVFGEPIKYRANFTNNERLLAQQMITYWTNFAKTGNPNHSNDPRAKPVGVTWPVHTPAGKEYLDLNSRYFVGSDKGTTGSSSSPAESVGSRSMAAMTSRATGRGPRANECGFWNEYLPDLMTFSDTDPRAVGDFPSTSSSPAAPVTTVACCEQPATSSAAAPAAPHSLRFRHQRQQQLPLLRSTWCWQVVLAVVAAATWTELLTGENKWPER